MWKVQYKALVTIKYMMFWRGGFLLCYWKSNSNWLELLRHLSSYIKGVQTCRGLPGWLIQQLYDLNKITGSFHLCTVTLLRLLIFLPAILILICASSSPAFLMMYSAYKLNKQGDDIQPWRTPFPIWTICCSMSSSNCCFLTCIQISQEASQVFWYSHLL